MFLPPPRASWRQPARAARWEGGEASVAALAGGEAAGPPQAPPHAERSSGERVPSPSRRGPGRARPGPAGAGWRAPCAPWPPSGSAAARAGGACLTAAAGRGQAARRARLNRGAGASNCTA